ncbi:MAG: glycosyltransferase family 9 protein, partial [Sulfurifustaceae bacterium]
APPHVVEPAITVTARDRAEVERIGLERDAGFAVIHPGATDPRRRWPVEKFAAAGQALARAGLRVVVIGTGEERRLVHAVAAKIVPPALEICDRVSLGGLAALLARSRVVVSNDSGPLHLAAAVGAATVGIYWCGNLINGGPMTRRWHRPSISWRLECPVCGRNTLYDNCEHRVSFVADVPVEEVTAFALALARDRAAERSIAA